MSLTRGLSVFLLFVLALIYLSTLSSYLPPGDSGELIVDALRLTTPHPPGYPLYTILGHFFTWIPFETMAWRLGLFSMLTQLVAAFFLFELMREMTDRPLVALVWTLGLCLCHEIWLYSVQAEVMALNHLLLTLFLWSTWRFEQRQQIRWIYWACLFLGFGAAHHLTLLLFALPIVIAISIGHWRQIFRLRVLLLGLLSFLIGLTPYGLLLIFDQHRELISWGDLSTWSGFFDHVLRREYGTFQLSVSLKENASFLSKITVYSHWLWSEAAIALVALSLLIWRRRQLSWRPFDWGLMGAVLGYSIAFNWLGNLDLHIPLYLHTQARMWTLPLIGLFLLSAKGFSQIQGVRVLSVFALALLLSSGANWAKVERAGSDFFERVGRSLLEGRPPNSVILIREDTLLNSLRYAQVVQEIRPDVHVLPLDSLWWPWMKGLVAANVPGFQIPARVYRLTPERPDEFNLLQLVRANQARFVMYVPRLMTVEEQAMRPEFSGLPNGFISRLYKVGTPLSLLELRQECDAFLNLAIPDRTQFQAASWEAYMIDTYYEIRYAMGVQVMEVAGGRGEWLQFAASILEEVAAHDDPLRELARERLKVLHSSLGF